MEPYGYLITVWQKYKTFDPTFQYVVTTNLLEYAKKYLIDNDGWSVRIVHSIPILTNEEYIYFKEHI